MRHLSEAVGRVADAHHALNAQAEAAVKAHHPHNHHRPRGAVPVPPSASAAKS